MDKKQIQYIYTHGFCDIYAYYLYKNMEGINQIIGLFYSDTETEETHLVHAFATNQDHLFDIFGSCYYSEIDALKHIKKYIPDLLDDCDDLYSCFLDTIDFDENIWEQRLHSILPPLEDMSPTKMTAYELIKLNEQENIIHCLPDHL